MNPVRARLVKSPFDWPWSSAQAHLDGKRKGLADINPLNESVGDWNRFLLEDVSNIEEFRKHERTGRPWPGPAYARASGSPPAGSGWGGSEAASWTSEITR